MLGCKELFKGKTHTHTPQSRVWYKPLCLIYFLKSQIPPFKQKVRAKLVEIPPQQTLTILLACSKISRIYREKRLTYRAAQFKSF